MNILLISQCHKNALKETRRVLDQFAERKGMRTWQTRITREGLMTLRKMLRQTARRNTAVACHWQKKAGDSELLWVVGRQNAFDENGNVPTNSTGRNLLKNRSEHNWQSAEVIALAAGIGGLFHDVGKANTLFQKKLKGASSHHSEPYRHEWVSLRLFLAFVDNRSDKDWLLALSYAENTNQDALQQRLITDGLIKESLTKDSLVNEHPVKENLSTRGRPFEGLAEFARLVAWLIVSHHRLPLASKKLCDFSQVEEWLESSFDASWNSSNFEKKWSEQDIQDVWSFPEGLPFASKAWQNKAEQLAKRALNHPAVFEIAWLHQRFTAHLARLSLMLADHYYSSLPAEASKTRWRDPTYNAYANTDRTQKKYSQKASDKQAPLKQKLDEHNIGVGHNALLFARNLPLLKTGLPAIGRHKVFSQRASDAKYKWQDKAYDIAYSQAETARDAGFFGINMASTGCGKTFANAKIMYGLAGGKNCRFNVALGLRTLTLQTGDAYRDMLNLAEDDLAVLIGSQAVKTLHELKIKSEKETTNASTQGKNALFKKDEFNEGEFNGSESANDFAEHLYVSYEGEIYDGRLKQWLSTSPKLQKMISAPIVVSTIDHLMPATDSLRGGKQIAPMLRLLTSDLVLDEPDDFDISDLPALCRLVNWAGVLGARVLLSSATLPPALITALFNAYQAGREHFNAVNGGAKPVVCAWFDEYTSQALTCSDSAFFQTQHKSYVQKRICNLKNHLTPLRLGRLVPIAPAPITLMIDSTVSSIEQPLFNRSDDTQATVQAYAHSIYQQALLLHAEHHTQDSSRTNVSLGVVRMANIKPMVAVARCLMAMDAPADTVIHYCIYHSQYPLALRSFIEQRLDASLNRHDPQAIWQQPEIAQALAVSAHKNHLFVVLGTAVVEVGRDHDYDWAIAEPSSLRSIIQLAGRVQRHRQIKPHKPNVVVFEQNIKALQEKVPAYCQPGFESTNLPLASHNLQNLLTDELAIISALPRIEEPTPTAGMLKNKQAISSLRAQEHRALIHALFAYSLPNKPPHKLFEDDSERPISADLWWKTAKRVDWHGEHIRQKPFRQSQPQEEYTLLWPEDEGLQWGQWDTTRKMPVWTTQNTTFTDAEVPLGKGISFWLSLDPEKIYSTLAEKLDKTEENVSRDFGILQLRAQKEGQNNNWQWHPQLGAFLEY